MGRDEDTDRIGFIVACGKLTNEMGAAFDKLDEPITVIEEAIDEDGIRRVIELLRPLIHKQEIRATVLGMLAEANRNAKPPPKA